MADSIGVLSVLIFNLSGPLLVQDVCGSSPALRWLADFAGQRFVGHDVAPVMRAALGQCRGYETGT
jgi:hypothetical protein